jgi:hypothetical protein
MLLAYERERSPRDAQSFVVEAVTRGQRLVASALSLATAGFELSGECPNLDWLVDDPDEPLWVLDVSSANARQIGELAAGTGPATATGLEHAHVLHEARAIDAIVVSYEPKLYAGTSIYVLDMQRR